MPLIVFIQSKGNMRRDEILAAPLFLLNSVYKELHAIWQQEVTARLGLLPTNGAHKAEARVEVDGRDDFFEFMNKHR